jgi:hypothetical protein
MNDSSTIPVIDFDQVDLQAETLEATATRSEVIDRLKTDGEFFIEFFIPEQLSMPVPSFHSKEIWPLLTSSALTRVLLAIPRGHSKTTLAKLAVAYYFLFSQYRFCIYVSNTNAFAVNACKDIIGFFRTANFVAVFGEIRLVKESETNSLWIFELPMPDGSRKRCVLRAVGANQQMRGMNIDNQRPDLAIVDDLEDNDNTASEYLQRKLDQWVVGPFLKALARTHKIIWLGNMIRKTCLLARLSLDPNWNPVVFGSILKDSETGELSPLWSDLWPLDKLLADLQEYKALGYSESWMCEMMNMPGHSDNGFSIDQINFAVVPGRDEFLAVWLTVDPAFGERAGTDDSAIAVHGLPNEGCPMVLDYRVGKFRDETLFNEILDLSHMWNCWVWGIEAVAAQRVLLPLYQVWLAIRGIQRHVEIIPLMSGRGDPKVGRISAWVGLMASGDYAIPFGAQEIVTQVLNYDMKKSNNRDDLIDACAYGPSMLNQYEYLLRSLYHPDGLKSSAAVWGTSMTQI